MNTCIWIHTEIPTELIDHSIEALKEQESNLESSQLGKTGRYDDHRTSEQLWVPAQIWISGWVKHYADLANENFKFDLNGIFQNVMQYTVYKEGGRFDWHVDGIEPSEDGDIRKLAFSIQLSDESEYEGGELEFLDGPEKFTAPKRKGTIIFFDPRITHRVRKVKSGTRRALVGWIGGPRWK